MSHRLLVIEHHSIVRLIEPGKPLAHSALFTGGLECGCV